MSSLLQILKENKKMVFQGIMHTAIYRVLWKEKLVILDFVKSKVKKKSRDLRAYPNRDYRIMGNDANLLISHFH